MSIGSPVSPGPGSAATDAARAPHLLLIDGQWQAGNGGEIAVEDPATEEPLTIVSAADAGDVDAAVAAARKALGGPWGRMTGAERAAILFRFADRLEQDSGLIAEVMALDTGQPIASCTAVVRLLAVELVRYYAGWATKIAGDSFQPSLGGARADLTCLTATLREPIGVVGAIIPWNAPAGMIALKVAPALAAGCTVVLKTAELAPLTGEFFARAFLEAGGPPGVFNLLHGWGHEAGAALAAHPGVDKISFTGSTAVGRQIVTSALGNLKKVTLELGGKSPVIVFPDADLEALVPAAVAACFVGSGQACMAGTRLFVHEAVHDKVVARVAEAADAMRLGLPFASDTNLGPLISRRQRERVEAYVQAGLDEGATLANRPAVWKGKGHFVAPHVFAGADMSMRIAREEIFGPVLTVLRFGDDEERLLADVNATEYGLSGSVWTRDIQRALRIVRQVDSGQVGINIHAAVSPETPFGGNRQSGWGREFGREGLDPYLKTKAVTMMVGRR